MSKCDFETSTMRGIGQLEAVELQKKYTPNTETGVMKDETGLRM
jgi:hypothetical protein